MHHYKIIVQLKNVLYFLNGLNFRTRAFHYACECAIVRSWFENERTTLEAARDALVDKGAVSEILRSRPQNKIPPPGGRNTKRNGGTEWDRFLRILTPVTPQPNLISLLPSQICESFSDALNPLRIFAKEFILVPKSS